MPSQSRTRKLQLSKMSPLLLMLTRSRAAHELLTRTMLLQAYLALDAFRRRHGSRNLFTILAQHLIVAEELCHLGHQPGAIADIEAAEQVMVNIDATETAEGTWLIRDVEYITLCLALEVFAEQLSNAPLGDIAKAQARAFEAIVRTEKLVTA